MSIKVSQSCLIKSVSLKVSQSCLIKSVSFKVSQSSGVLYQSVLRFGGCWAQYVAALNQWKSVDIDRLIEELHRYWEQLQVSAISVPS